MDPMELEDEVKDKDVDPTLFRSFIGRIQADSVTNAMLVADTSCIIQQPGVCTLAMELPHGGGKAMHVEARVLVSVEFEA